MLDSTDVAGHPREYFWNLPYWYQVWHVSDTARYIEHVQKAGTTPNGVFGIKLMSYQFDHLRAVVSNALGESDASLHDLVAQIFPNPRYIWLTRRDKVRQAVSLHRAHQTAHWQTAHARERPPAATPSFDFELIDLYVGTIVLGDAAWQDYFAAGNIEPFTIVYEDFIRDPISDVGAILDWLVAQTSGPLQAKAWQHEKQAE
jgi:trehalose 2-sulfotransferase